MRLDDCPTWEDVLLHTYIVSILRLKRFNFINFEQRPHIHAQPKATYVRFIRKTR